MTTCTPTNLATDHVTENPNVAKPRYTVNSSKDAYQIRVDLPGVPKDGVRIHLEDGVLTLHASRKPVAAESWKSLYRELAEFDYALRLKITAKVDDGGLTARLEDGVLTLELPVKEAAKPRVIPVQ